jgi:hypothetical protein
MGSSTVLWLTLRWAPAACPHVRKCHNTGHIVRFTSKPSWTEPDAILGSVRRAGRRKKYHKIT